MTWPTDPVDTSALDAGTDTPPRATFFTWAQKFNQLIAHVTGYMQGLLGSADAAAARTTLDVPSRAGSGASGTWGISISGGAATATNAAQLGGVAASGYQAALGFTPVQQGGAVNQGANRIRLGWGTAVQGMLLAVDDTDFGNVWPMYPENSRLMTQYGSNHFGGIGTLGLFRKNSNSLEDELVSGSLLNPAGLGRASDNIAYFTTSSATAPGTWRCLSYSAGGGLGALGLYMRVY